MTLNVGSLTNHFSCYEYLWKQCEEEAEVCDVTVKFDDGEKFRAHWCVLLSCPYFTGLYNSGMKERSTAILELTIVPADIAKLALKFLYLRCVKATPEQLPEILKIADYLQMEALTKACTTRIKRDIGIREDNCLEMYSLGEMYHAKELQDMGLAMLYSGFEKIMLTESILKISVEFLISILNEPALKRIRAKYYFDLINRWVDYSEDRIDSFPRLFACLDLKDIPMEVLQDEIVRNGHVRHHDVCKQFMEDHFRLIGSGLLDPKNPDRDVILITGQCVLGRNTDNLKTYAYVIEDDHWTQFATMPLALSGKLAVVGGRAYMCGINPPLDVRYLPLVPPLDNNKLKVCELASENVRKNWTHLFNEHSSSQTFKTLACASSEDGSLIIVKQVKNWEIRLKIYPASYLRWCTDRKTNPHAHQPARMPMSVRLYRIPEDDRTLDVSALVVCREEIIFTHVRLKSKEKLRNHSYFFNSRTTTLRKFIGGKGIKGEVLYLEDRTAYLETPGCRFSFICDLNEMIWYDHPRGLPYLPRVPVIKEYSIINHRRDLYALCLTGRKTSSTNTLYKLNREDHVWEQLSVFPLNPGLRNFSLGIMTVNKMKVRCPVNCEDCTTRLCRASHRRTHVGEEDHDPHDVEEDDTT